MHGYETSVSYECEPDKYVKIGHLPHNHTSILKKLVEYRNYLQINPTSIIHKGSEF